MFSCCCSHDRACVRRRSPRPRGLRRPYPSILNSVFCALLCANSALPVAAACGAMWPTLGRVDDEWPGAEAPPRCGARTVLRVRGRRSGMAQGQRGRRARERAFLLEVPPDKVHILVDRGVAREAKLVCAAMEETRALELRSGIHRRNGSDLTAALLREGRIIPDEAARLRDVRPRHFL